MRGPTINAAPPQSQVLERSHGTCRECVAGGADVRTVEVRYVARDGQVFLEGTCATHGEHSALVCESVARFPEASSAATGRCATRCQLPVISITNVCDLRCPICFTWNRPDAAWHMSADEFSAQLDHVLGAVGSVDLVDITGGEPTTHPELFALLARAKRPGIGRVAINTNGLRLARDPGLARRFADEGVHVALSLNTFDPELCRELQGRDIVDEKRRALENLERAGVETTLIFVLIAGQTEEMLPSVLDLLLGTSFVRSLCVQTMAYTGQGGGTFGPRQHIPVDGAARRVAVASAGRIRAGDFAPLPAAHPLCYRVGYFFLDDAGGAHSLVDLIGPDFLSRYGADGYLMRPGPALETELREAVDRLWSSGEQPALLQALRQVLERQRPAEDSVKSIYIHTHMDEDTWESGRSSRCPIQVPVVDGDGTRLVGACDYTLFHRRRDERGRAR